MKYAVWQKKLLDGRATERVNLTEDYVFTGYVEADNRRHVERLLASQEDTGGRVAGATRRLLVGDVLVEQESKDAYSYTPTGAWASVKVVL